MPDDIERLPKKLTEHLSQTQITPRACEVIGPAQCSVEAAQELRAATKYLAEFYGLSPAVMANLLAKEAAHYAWLAI